MTTSSYGDGIQRSYGELAGLRLLDDLETAGLDPFTVADAKAQGKTLGLGASHTTSLLHRLSAGGRLTRLKKGVYAINDPLSGCPGRTLSPSARLSSLHPRLALVCLPALGIDGTDLGRGYSLIPDAYVSPTLETDALGCAARGW